MSAELATVKAENSRLRIERKNLQERVRRLSLANERHRQQVGSLRVDLTRARQDLVKWPGGPISDLEIATVMLEELRDRLVTESGRTASRGAAVGLRLAAREVSRTRDRVAERGYINTEQVAA